MGCQWCPRAHNCRSAFEKERERAREREGERAREKEKISEREREKEPEMGREDDREREREERERAIDRAVYGDVRSAMCRTIHTAMDRTILSYV